MQATYNHYGEQGERKVKTLAESFKLKMLKLGSFILNILSSASEYHNYYQECKKNKTYYEKNLKSCSLWVWKIFLKLLKEFSLYIVGCQQGLHIKFTPQKSILCEIGMKMKQIVDTQIHSKQKDNINSESKMTSELL